MAESSREQDRQREFDRIVHEYYCAVERGESPRLKEFIALYPRFQEELDSFFSDVQHIAGPPPLAENPLRTISQTAEYTTGGLRAEDLPKTSEYIQRLSPTEETWRGGIWRRLSGCPYAIGKARRHQSSEGRSRPRQQIRGKVSSGDQSGGSLRA